MIDKNSKIRIQFFYAKNLKTGEKTTMNKNKLMSSAIAGLVAAGFALNSVPAKAEHEEGHDEGAAKEKQACKSEKAACKGAKKAAGKKMNKGENACGGKAGCKGEKKEKAAEHESHE